MDDNERTVRQEKAKLIKERVDLELTSRLINQANVILSMVGNTISGQVRGDSGKPLMEQLGKIKQDSQSLTVYSNETSINKSKQLDYTIPLSTWSAGEVVGRVTDRFSTLLVKNIRLTSLLPPFFVPATIFFYIVLFIFIALHTFALSTYIYGPF